MKKQPTVLSAEQTYAIILRELAENIDRYRKREAFILDGNKELCDENEELLDKVEELFAKVDDLAQQLAVTECQLEDARKRLERYEGGGK